MWIPEVNSINLKSVSIEGEGMSYVNINDTEAELVFLNTLKKQFEGYKNQEVKRAKLAW